MLFSGKSGKYFRFYGYKCCNKFWRHITWKTHKRRTRLANGWTRGSWIMPVRCSEAVPFKTTCTRASVWTSTIPTLKTLTLEALTPLDFQRMLNALASVYSKSSVAHIKVVYCEAYQEAVRNNLCFRNPIREVQIPKHAARKKVSGMTIPEQDAFESVLTQLSHLWITA